MLFVWILLTVQTLISAQSLDCCSSRGNGTGVEPCWSSEWKSSPFVANTEAWCGSYFLSFSHWPLTTDHWVWYRLINNGHWDLTFDRNFFSVWTWTEVSDSRYGQIVSVDLGKLRFAKEWSFCFMYYKKKSTVISEVPLDGAIHQICENISESLGLILTTRTKKFFYICIGHYTHVCYYIRYIEPFLIISLYVRICS